MEQREEKTENIKRKRRRRIKSSSSSESSLSSSLPLDLTSEIFSRLPAKSVVRFRCVSKLWSSITTDPYFTNSFQTRPNLMFFFKEGDKFFVFTIPQHNRNPNESYSYSSSEIIDSYHTTYPKGCCVTTITESVHGLICFRKAANPIVWNPSMRKFLPLPLRKPDDRWKNITVSLGYDPVDGKHKVVCIPYGTASYECPVLTLGSDKEWRTVKTNHKNSPFTFYGGVSYGAVSYGQGRCINGVLYYRAETNSGRVILSFDVRSEKFDVIEFPWDKDFWPVMMMSYKGRSEQEQNRGEEINELGFRPNMEQGEEKNENITRKSGRRSEPSSLSKSASSLPLDLTSEILLRLPAKSAVRFRSVSKLWSSITTNPYFINSFQSRPNLLLFFKEGYEPVEGKHKVVCMPCGRGYYDECQVLTLGSDQESWRTVKTNHKRGPVTVHRTICYGQCRCINGVIYYLASINFVTVIMSFDVRSEKFDVIDIPWDNQLWPMMIISYEGRLACLSSNGNNSRSMWVLEDAQKHEWSSYNLLPISHYDPGSEDLFKLIGITIDGELIYVPRAVFKSFDVIYIDPKRKTFRRVEYRGIGDKDFRQRNELGDKPLRGLQFYPNHIETLMSM
ncbi:F-box associated domain type 3 [Arabidopsis thaliana x Arabidopsis arenosa]|uniref:F-box associated domain type 3 n=1 Tax=Arabidopsis thaliana x Arabidopsis arenosa TaxID=1240361 RepID=A0A8T2C5U8_9BRAS|nr:F-box associated domain type 3 [Arabidopsis thaliana x Arabidopsis arenosa]